MASLKLYANPYKEHNKRKYLKKKKKIILLFRGDSHYQPFHSDMLI